MSKSIQYSKGVVLCFCLIAISACSATSKELNTQYVETENTSLEVIYDFDIKAESLWFLVQSNGCTNEKSFNLQVDKLDGKAVKVSLYRKKRDLCRGLSKLISINMPINSNIKNSHYIVNNPFSVKPNRVNR